MIGNSELEVEAEVAGEEGEGAEGVEGARERYRGFRFKETWP